MRHSWPACRVTPPQHSPPDAAIPRRAPPAGVQTISASRFPKFRGFAPPLDTSMCAVWSARMGTRSPVLLRTHRHSAPGFWGLENQSQTFRKPGLIGHTRHLVTQKFEL
jgi:hypothetical protein